MTFHIKSLLDEWQPRIDSAEWVLGVVYKTQGPCYRKPGAMMFFNSDGGHFGLLSGGCLEADIQLHARRVMQSGQASTLCYDGKDEDDISFQLGIGCGGTVYIALLPITHTNDYLHLKEIHHALGQRESGILQLKIPDEQGAVAARFHRNNEDDRTDVGAQLSSTDGAEWLSVSVRREPHLMVVGGGVDARPVVSLARELGWEVTLWDSRPANARRQYFMSASTILDCSVDKLGRYAIDQRVDAAVLMTHNVELDAASLRALAQTPLHYLGLLGPTSRKQQVLEVAQLAEEEIEARLAGPAGLDLGGELPESIALSIVSECHAHFNGYTGESVTRKT